VILTGRNADRLQHAVSEVDALSTAAFDAADPLALDRFFVTCRRFGGREVIAAIFAQSSATRGSGTYTEEFKLDERTTFLREGVPRLVAGWQ
jgi:hypothetical protein